MAVCQHDGPNVGLSATHHHIYIYIYAMIIHVNNSNRMYFFRFGTRVGFLIATPCASESTTRLMVSLIGTRGACLLFLLPQ